MSCGIGVSLEAGSSGSGQPAYKGPTCQLDCQRNVCDWWTRCRVDFHLWCTTLRSRKWSQHDRPVSIEAADGSGSRHRSYYQVTVSTAIVTSGNNTITANEMLGGNHSKCVPTFAFLFGNNSESGDVVYLTMCTIAVRLKLDHMEASNLIIRT